ncbi:MAG: DUF262 domain-containing protein [Parasphingorhabdus sp.]|uniref:DUF262 domain-containing protein n=1 Tax=Parasphingorhabdus sp. TaxID=2709688 RepID=UPI00329796DB
MKASAESRRIANIIKSIREESLVPRPDFQRRSVWTNKDRIAFIETILSDYPFPEIYIAASNVDTVSGVATELLVDGQQRMQTIFDYFNGAPPFKRTKSITLYKNLLEEQKRDFLNYEVAVRNLGLHDDSIIREIFTRMNRTSYDLNEMERFNANYLGEYKKFCEAIAERDFFKGKKIFSSADIRRMKDVSYIASLVATMLSTYFHRDSEVENYLEKYNDEFPQYKEIFVRMNNVCGYLFELGLEDSSRAWKKVDFYTLFVEVDRQLHKERRKPNTAEAAKSLTNLFSAVDEAREDPPEEEEARKYFETTLQATNDRSNRIKRGEVIAQLLSSVPNESFELEIPEEDIVIEGFSVEIEEGD